MNKIYYKLLFKQKSPLRISNGDNENSDNDLFVDKRGIPFIPGSSIAGVLRRLFDKEKQNDIFGYVGIDGIDDKSVTTSESKIIISDAVLEGENIKENIKISKRHGVGLNKYSTSIDNRKYDFEILEIKDSKKLMFRSIIEINDIEIDDVLSKISNDGIKFGARTTRGYGDMEVQVSKRVFDFDNKDDFNTWLDFNPFDSDSGFIELDGTPNMRGLINENSLDIKLQIEMVGGHSVAVDNSGILSDGNNAPDSVPTKNINGNVIIPGTSWAGVFRHHMEKLNDELKFEINLEEVFGFAKKKEKMKSKITFSETVLKETKTKIITRNAIDRFTFSTIARALFTDEVAYYGSGELKIKINNLDKFDKEKFLLLLEIAILDLNNGLISVGSDATIGRGLVKIIKVDDDDEVNIESNKLGFIKGQRC